MTVFCVAGALLCLYFFAIPVKFALIMRIDPQPKLVFGAALFENRFAKRTAQRRAALPKKSKKRMPQRLSAKVLPAARASACYLLRHIRPESFCASGAVAARDAAATALLYGSIHTFGGMIAPIFAPGHFKIDLRPDFSGQASTLELCGMFSLRIGHIILAALIAAFHYANGRLTQWKNTRSKTS